MKIGPNFGVELIAVGLGGKPIAFDESGVTVSPGLSSRDLDLLQGVISNHDPTKVPLQRVDQVSDTQFIQALAEDKYKIINWQEAMDWGAQGILPAILTTALDSIADTATRNRAYMKARSAKTYIFSDQWVQSILQLLPKEVVAKMPGTDAQDKLQQLFNFAATL